ncbi:MAG: hypothetical protein Q4G59_08120, partial [Planctomycetia bacterium]|nr:hypothetical protein [Planctomycetia bacterium]
CCDPAPVAACAPVAPSCEPACAPACGPCFPRIKAAVNRPLSCMHRTVNGIFVALADATAPRCCNTCGATAPCGCDAPAADACGPVAPISCGPMVAPMAAPAVAPASKIEALPASPAPKAAPKK